MYLPDYHGGSIVNLMSSIIQALGGESPYEPLADLPPTELSASKNIVLLVLDGLGYEYLVRNGQHTVFHKYLRGKMTSVFPSTTAACVTTFATGVAPQQHGVTGWFVHLKEVGAVSTILRFAPRYGEKTPPFSQAGVKPEAIFTQVSMSNGLEAKVYMVVPRKLVESDYSRLMAGKAKPAPYENLNDFFKRIRKIIRSGKRGRPKYIYAYWPEFDALSHEHGNGGKKVAAHFKKLDKKMASFLQSLAGTETTLIITADHGFIDADASRIIWLKDHPDLQETLTLPLCGEGRAAYCYVRPAKAAQFEAYVTKYLHDKCDWFRSEELIANHYFGLFEPNPRLFDRVGDYVLIMKENYVIRDSILGEDRHLHIGYHGGVSEAEMFVPLIVARM
ncbi:MAG: alkaline phosphatase family protein [Anaerolineae bacterium]|nr:alkaline phosphatase family protein [Anaerolineae bacterium]